MSGVKTVLLLRHAKSSWRDRDLDDAFRPLKKRGKRAAPRMGQLLGELNLRPDLIVSSNAVRALDTARLVAEACGYRGEVIPTAELYHADPETHLSLLRSMPPISERILLVGHNPGMEDLIAHLIGRRELFPTAALAYIELHCTRWTEITPALTGELLGLWRPKELADGE